MKKFLGILLAAFCLFSLHAWALLPTTNMLAPIPNQTFVVPSGNVYVSQSNGLILNVQSQADVSALQSSGCVVVTPRNNVSTIRIPTGSDDFTANYQIGSYWVYVNGPPLFYILTSMTTTPGSAVWTLANASTATSVSNGAVNFVPTNGYTGNLSAAIIVDVLDSVGSPNTGVNAPNVMEVIGATNSIGAVAPALYLAGIKTQNGNSYHLEGLFSEAQDNVGWTGSIGGANNNFIEGARTQAFLHSGATLGSAYGLVTVSYEANTSTQPLYMISHEAEVDPLYADAPITFNQNHFAASFLATSDNGIAGAKKPDAAFIINPFNGVPFYRGFFVPRGASPGASVYYSGFQMDDEATFGVELEQCICTIAIGIPNNSPIRGVNAAGTGDFNVLYVGTDNTLRLGADSNLAGIVLGSPLILTPIELEGPVTNNVANTGQGQSNAGGVLMSWVDGQNRTVMYVRGGSDGAISPNGLVNIAGNVFGGPDISLALGGSIEIGAEFGNYAILQGASDGYFRVNANGYLLLNPSSGVVIIPNSSAYEGLSTGSAQLNLVDIETDNAEHIGRGGSGFTGLNFDASTINFPSIPSRGAVGGYVLCVNPGGAGTYIGAAGAGGC